MADTLEKQVILNITTGLETGDIEKQARAAARAINSQLGNIGSGAKYEVFKKIAHWLDVLESKAIDLKTLNKDASMANLFGEDMVGFDKSIAKMLGPLGDTISEYYDIRKELHRLMSSKDVKDVKGVRALAERTNSLLSSVGITDLLDLEEFKQNANDDVYLKRMQTILTTLADFGKLEPNPKWSWENAFKLREFKAVNDKMVDIVESRLKTIKEQENKSNDQTLSKAEREKYKDLAQNSKYEFAKFITPDPKSQRKIYDPKDFDSPLWSLYGSGDARLKKLAQEIFESYIVDEKRAVEMAVRELNYNPNSNALKDYEPEDGTPVKQDIEQKEKVSQENLNQTRTEIAGILDVIGEEINNFVTKLTPAREELSTTGKYFHSFVERLKDFYQSLDSAAVFVGSMLERINQAKENSVRIKERNLLADEKRVEFEETKRKKAAELARRKAEEAQKAAEEAKKQEAEAVIEQVLEEAKTKKQEAAKRKKKTTKEEKQAEPINEEDVKKTLVELGSAFTIASDGLKGIARQIKTVGERAEGAAIKLDSLSGKLKTDEKKTDAKSESIKPVAKTENVLKSEDKDKLKVASTVAATGLDAIAGALVEVGTKAGDAATALGQLFNKMKAQDDKPRKATEQKQETTPAEVTPPTPKVKAPKVEVSDSAIQNVDTFGETVKTAGTKAQAAAGKVEGLANKLQQVVDSDPQEKEPSTPLIDENVREAVEGTFGAIREEIQGFGTVIETTGSHAAEAAGSFDALNKHLKDVADTNKKKIKPIKDEKPAVATALDRNTFDMLRHLELVISSIDPINGRTNISTDALYNKLLNTFAGKKTKFTDLFQLSDQSRFESALRELDAKLNGLLGFDSKYGLKTDPVALRSLLANQKKQPESKKTEEAPKEVSALEKAKTQISSVLQAIGKNLSDFGTQVGNIGDQAETAATQLDSLYEKLKTNLAEEKPKIKEDPQKVLTDEDIDLKNKLTRAFEGVETELGWLSAKILGLGTQAKETAGELQGLSDKLDIEIDDNIQIKLTNLADSIGQKVVDLFGKIEAAGQQAKDAAGHFEALATKLKATVDNVFNEAKKVKVKKQGVEKQRAVIEAEAKTEKPDYALEGTLQDVKGVLETIRDAIKAEQEKKNKSKTDKLNALSDILKTGQQSLEGILKDQNRGIAEKIKGLTDSIKGQNKSLSNAIRDIAKAVSNQKESSKTEVANLVRAATHAAQRLDNTAAAITETVKAKQHSTATANERIKNSEGWIIKNAQYQLADKSYLGTAGIDVTSMQALSNGAIKVAGNIQTGKNEWKSFNFTLTESGAITDLLIAKNEKLTQTMLEAAAAAKSYATASQNAAHMSDLDEFGSYASAQYKALGLSPTLGDDELVHGTSAKKIRDTYNSVFKIINEAKAGTRIVTDADIKHLRESVGLLERLANAEREYQQSLKGTYKQLKYIATTNTYDATMGSYRTNFFGTDTFDEMAERLTEAYNKIQSIQSRLESGENTIEIKAEFNQAISEFSKLEKEMSNLMKVTTKMHNESLRDPFKIDSSDLRSKEARIEALTKAMNQFDGASAKVKRFNQAYTELYYTITDGNGAVIDMVAAFDKANTAIVASSTKVTQSTSFIRGFFDTIGGKLRSLTAYVGVHELFSVLRTGINYVREIDSAMTELKKVTDETYDTYAKFQDRVSKVAPSVASTPAEFITSTADWARLGLSLDDAEMMARNTSILMNVSEFDNIEDATNSMVSAMQAYKYEASDTMEIIDAFNSIGNNFAISTAEAADSLTRSSAAMYAAGNDLNQTLALTAAANTFVQDPESVGNALKTLSMRIRGTKVELEAAGEDTEGMAESTSKLREQVLALTNVDGKGGFDILTDSGAYKSTYDIIVGIAEVWKEMDAMNQPALLELIAGKQRGSIVAGMLENPELIKEAYAVAEASAGSAAIENEKYLNSIDGKLQILSASFQTLWANLLDEGIFKFFLDIANAAIKAADAMGPLAAALSGVLLYKQFFAKNKLNLYESLFGTRDADGNVEKRGLISRATEKVRGIYGKGYEKVTGKPYKVDVDVETDNAFTKIDKLKAKIQNLKDELNAESLKMDAIDAEFEASFAAIMGNSKISRLKDDIASAEKELSKLADGFTLLDKRVAEIDPKTKLEMPDMDEVASRLDSFNEAASKGNQATKKWLEENIDLLTDSEAMYIKMGQSSGKALTAQGFADALKDYNAQLKGTGAMAKLASVGQSLFNVALEIGASIAINALIEGITALIFAEERAAEKAREAAEAYKEATSSYQSNAKTISEIGAEYDELARGVDSMGNNIGLSADEFARYNEITNQIAEMFPTLVSGYTEQGNAIVNLTGQTEDLTTATAALNAENEKKLRIANAELLTKSGDLSDNLKYAITGSDFETIKALRTMVGGGSIDWTRTSGAVLRNAADSLETMGFDVKDYIKNTTSSEYADINNLLVLANTVEDVIHENAAAVSAYVESALAEAEMAMNYYQEATFARLNFSDLYKGLATNHQSFIQDNVNNMDIFDMLQYVDEGGEFDNQKFFNDMVMPLVTAFDTDSVKNALKNIDDINGALATGEISIARFMELKADILEEINKDKKLSTNEKSTVMSALERELRIDEAEASRLQNVAKKHVLKSIKLVNPESPEYKQLQSDYESYLKSPWGQLAAKTYEAQKLEFDLEAYLSGKIDTSDWTYGALKDIDNAVKEVNQYLEDRKVNLTENYGGAIDESDNKFKVGNVAVDELAKTNTGWKKTMINGQEYAIHYNAVFNGEDMTEQDLANYMDEITYGATNASDIFEADKNGKGILLHINTDFESVADEDQFSKNIAASISSYAHAVQNEGVIAKIFGSLNPTSSLVPVDSYDTLSAKATNYNAVLTSLNGQIFNNMRLTDEQAAALEAYVGNTAEYAQAVDKTNGNVIKNVDLLEKAIEAKREDDVATIKQARAQARLRYYELSKDLKSYIKDAESLTAEQYKNIDATLDQLDSLEAIIGQYSALEVQLLGATNAFNEFTAAQEVDSATDYTSQFTSMLKALSDGFSTGRVGTEAFKKAIEGLVPDSVLDGLTNAYDKMTAIENYVANDLGRYFTIDGENFEVNHDDITNFINDAIQKGVFTADSTTTKFDIAEGMNFETLTEKMNLTKEAAFAIIDEINNRNVYGDNLFDDLMANSEDVESRLWAANKSLTELYAQKAELIRNNKDGSNTDAIFKIDADITAAEMKMDAISAEVADVVRAGSEAKIEIETILNDKGFSDYYERKKQGMTDEQIEVVLDIDLDETDYVETHKRIVEDLEVKKQKAEDLTEYEVTLAVDTIDRQLKDLREKLKGAEGDAAVKIKADISELESDREILLGTGKVDTNTIESELEVIQEFTIADKRFRIIIANGKATLEFLDALENGDPVERELLLTGNKANEQLVDSYKKHIESGNSSADPALAEKIWSRLEKTQRKTAVSASEYKKQNDQILNTLTDVTSEMETQSRIGYGIQIKSLENSLLEAGYDPGTIDAIISDINEQFRATINPNIETESISEATDLLMRLGVQYKGIQEDGKLSLVVDDTSLTNALTQLGYTDQQIAAIKQKWEASGIKVETEFTKRGDEMVGHTAADLASLPDNTVITTFKAQDFVSGLATNIRNIINQIPTTKTVNIVGNVSNTLSSLFGGSRAYGNAFASGNAHATGNIGLPHAEHRSLVGELGPELVVDPYRGIYKTVGDHGPEMVDLPKGAIIFNHLQTRDLLKNGATKMRGMALATGNAYTGGLWTPSNGIANGSAGNSSSNNNDDKTKSALDALLEKYANLFDWIEIKLDRVSKVTQKKIDAIDDYTQSIDKTLATADEAIKKVNEEIKVNKQAADKYQKQADKVAKETGLSSSIVSKIKNGSLDITEYNEDTRKKIDEYQKWYEKAVACKEAVEDLNETEKELYARRFDEIEKYYGNSESTYDFRSSITDTRIDYRESKGGPQSDDYYGYKIGIEQDRKNHLLDKRLSMLNELNRQVANGKITKYSDEWYDFNSRINDVNLEIIECDNNIEELNNKIGEIRYDNFDMLMAQFDALESEISHLYTLTSDNPVAEKDDYYQWTDEAITSIGLQAQAMEIAQKKAAEYQEEINYLDAHWKELGYSEAEYKEKRADLVDSMWTEIEAVESAKDAIVDLNRRRVDAIKDGIQKEIDAYSKLIAKRKEDLDVQKDAYDWKNSVDEKTKDIDKIDAQLAALEGDASMAAAAERKKLLEQKAEAEKELADMKYEHNIDTQQKAYDDELEDFQEEKEREIEALEEYLEDVDRVTADSLALIANHGTEIAGVIGQTAKDLGISISDAIVSPWKDGEGAMDSFATKLEGIQTRFEQLQANADTNARYDIEYADDRQRVNSGYKSTPPKGAVVQIQIDSAATWSDGSAIAKEDRNTDFTVTKVDTAKNLVELRTGAGKKWINARWLYGYAKGTLGVPRSDFAVVDEGGFEELIMHADKNGRVAYLTKGSSVIPHDITENLMKIGQLDPTEVLRRSMPTMDVVPMITNNNMEINLDIAEVVHIDHADSTSIPEIEQAIEDKLNSYMKSVNQAMKKYIR